MNEERSWLIRTRSNKILGPVSRKKVIELLEKGSLRSGDEISSSSGYWFFVNEEELLKKYIYEGNIQSSNPLNIASSFLSIKETSKRPQQTKQELEDYDDITDIISLDKLTSELNDEDKEKVEVKEESNEVKYPSSEQLDYPEADDNDENKEIKNSKKQIDTNNNVLEKEEEKKVNNKNNFEEEKDKNKVNDLKKKLKPDINILYTIALVIIVFMLLILFYYKKMLNRNIFSFNIIFPKAYAEKIYKPQNVIEFITFPDLKGKFSRTNLSWDEKVKLVTDYNFDYNNCINAKEYIDKLSIIISQKNRKNQNWKKCSKFMDSNLISVLNSINTNNNITDKKGVKNIFLKAYNIIKNNDLKTSSSKFNFANSIYNLSKEVKGDFFLFNLLRLISAIIIKNKTLGRRIMELFIQQGPYIKFFDNFFFEDIPYDKQTEFLNYVFKITTSFYKDDMILKMFITKIHSIVSSTVSSSISKNYSFYWSLSDIRKVIKSYTYGKPYIGFWFMLLSTRVTGKEINKYLESILSQSYLEKIPYYNLWIFLHYFPEDKYKILAKRIVDSYKSNNRYLQYIALRLLDNNKLRLEVKKIKSPLSKAKYYVNKVFFSSLLKEVEGKKRLFVLYNLIRLRDYNPKYLLWLAT